jgi:sugar transferase (PEP-CTERM system associated)
MLPLLMNRASWRLATLVGFDIGSILGAVGVSVYVSLGPGPLGSLSGHPMLAGALFFAAVCQLSFYYGDLYHPAAFGARRELFGRILRALGATACVLALTYLLFPALIIGREIFAITALLVIALVFGWRVVFMWLWSRMSARERLLIVGTNPAAIKLARELYDRPDLGVEVVGFIDPDPEKVGTPLFNPGIIGTIESIPQIVSSRGVDRVVVSLAEARGRLPMEQLLEMKLKAGVDFDHLASVYEEYTCKIAVELLRPGWLIFSPGFRKSWGLRVTKRLMDVVAAAVGMVVFAPVMLVTALAVKLTSRGPVVYSQERVGRHGRPFTIHKFRSMCHDAEAVTGAVWSPPDDERVTKVGRLLRRTRLDELPQLWNILRGDMSLVGPRPERPSFVDELTRQIPFYHQRHVVKPGLTGWAQVRYTYGATVEDAMEKLQYDLFYIKHMSVALDLLTVLQTIKTVAQGRIA